MADPSDDIMGGGKATGTGKLEFFPFVINGKKQSVVTGGEELEIFVRSGDTNFLLSPLDKTDWEMAIRKRKKPVSKSTLKGK